MTTQKNISDKILHQCQNLFHELSTNDDEFKSLIPLPSQKSLISGIPQSPSLLVFNNSFLFRPKPQLKTTKSPYYLAITSFPPVDETDLVIAKASLTRDWSYISPQAKTYPNYNNLMDSINLQLDDLGEIIYILIGKVLSPKVIKEPINTSYFSEVIFDCNILQLDIVGKQIFVNPNLPDIEIWNLFCNQTTLPDLDIQKVKPRLFNTLEKLRKKLRSPLSIPNNSSNLEDTFFDQVLNSIEKEISDYKSSLDAWRNKIDSEKNFTNILRISYNFVDDIDKLLRLIVSISDLKPLLFWLTIYSQYLVKLEFSRLDWQKTNKPSIAEYSRLIKGARNSKFHNMMNMNNTLEVDMNNIIIQAKRLIFFNEYPNKNQNNFEFQDQQLIDVLVEFNRVAEKNVSDDFWTQNLAIMKAANNLVRDFTESLKLLRLLG
ncbi:MAG: hypothetical protein SVR94_14835 [Pseudomonadota bacterium]|nr:hypothetical protein [Pseudomonadota bacterium]